MRAALLTQKLCHPNICIRELIDFRIFFVFLLCFRVAALSEIQHYHIFAIGPVPAVSILFEFIFFDHGTESIHSRHTNKLFIHILGTIGFCVDGDHMSRGCRRFSSASA